MTPELEAEILDFFHWFCGEEDPKDARIRFMEEREGITYLEVADRINAKLKSKNSNEGA